MPSGTTRWRSPFPITLKVFLDVSISPKFKPHNSETRIPDAYKTSSIAKSRRLIAVVSSPALTSSAFNICAASSTSNTSGKVRWALGIERFAPRSLANHPFAAAQLVKARIETILLVNVLRATPVVCRLASQDRICSKVKSLNSRIFNFSIWAKKDSRSPT